ncbi:hypothetical protein DL89DRAFT_267001 [Linderina pennispora]|uniref:Uncharacterized protein n=1 Tax=Linderina pennispora TaxID=61395 RepID=A0A1Y1WBH7_9FUNG|nr:uncharacterized protein DL89DRAFT_267001 [Linderina pennispora]ORX70897.1 hypothetical protein DL89DRAFT_267001 [Linderina pennispora]
MLDAEAGVDAPGNKADTPAFVVTSFVDTAAPYRLFVGLSPGLDLSPGFRLEPVVKLGTPLGLHNLIVHVAAVLGSVLVALALDSLCREPGMTVSLGLPFLYMRTALREVPGP